MKKNLPRDVKTVISVDGDEHTTIIASGWPGRWHCITENGLTMDARLDSFTTIEVLRKYGSDALDLMEGRSVVFTTKNMLNDKRTIN